MELSFAIQGNTGIVSISGYLDVQSQGKFEEYFSQQIKQAPKTIAINLQQLQYIDSSGIGSLVRCMTEAKNQQKELVLFGANGEIMEIFNVAKLAKFFNILSAKEFDTKYGLP